MPEEYVKVEDLGKRPTVGALLAATESEHQKQQIEVGEFVEYFGEHEVMKKIWKAIDARRNLPQWQPRFWVVTLLKKNPVLHRALQLAIHCRHTAPLPEPGLDCYVYDTQRDALDLVWTLPERHAFRTFIQTREFTHPFLMKCIDEYLIAHPEVKISSLIL